MTISKQHIENIFNILKKENPNPQTELEFTDNFTLTIAVVLSAQATDKSVNKATKKLFLVANTPHKILLLGEDSLKKYISSIGLYNSKAKNIISLCKILIEEFNSEIPDNFDDLIKLPGVGRKTANVILNCAFNKKTIAVDTHVYRVSRRIGISTSENIIKLEEDLLRNIPSKFLKDAHHWLILQGRYICIARTPKCDICKIRSYCKFYKNINSINN